MSSRYFTDPFRDDRSVDAGMGLTGLQIWAAVLLILLWAAFDIEGDGLLHLVVSNRVLR